MNYFFPVAFLTRIAKNNKLLTYATFLVYILLSTLNNKDRLNPPINFFSPGESYIWDIYYVILKFIYSPFGFILYSFILYTIFFWILYVLSGAKKNERFLYFTLPFISLAFLAILLQSISFIFSFAGFKLSFIGYITSLYAIIFFSIVLKKEWGIKTIRGVSSVFLAFILVILCAFAIIPGFGFVLQSLS